MQIHIAGMEHGVATRSAHLEDWLNRLGYPPVGGALHRVAGHVPADHRYGIEVRELLSPQGGIHADAVFDVEGVPTVCFFDDQGEELEQSGQIEKIREKIWNQNLVSVILVVHGETLTPYPVQRVRRIENAKKPLSFPLDKASDQGHYSAAEIRSGAIQARLPQWFRSDRRVDKILLKSLGNVVRRLSLPAKDEKKVPGRRYLARSEAQLLVGQLMFVLYLEHREIIGEQYRRRYGVKPLHELIKARDPKAIVELLGLLKDHFNGDFLEPIGGSASAWERMDDWAFDLLDAFLRHEDLDSGQCDFWDYDFSYIPVELLSGIYESFMGDERKAVAAYYTPRHLANLVVSEAFRDSEDPTEETVYDGACGSGILLTTAYRHMLGVAEARAQRNLSLKERIELLKRHIFGSDISEMACRVTAFSLYLSLFERLAPADIVAREDEEQIKLPPLKGKNLHGGDDADFFSPQNLFAKRDFTLFLNNPPWQQPKGNHRTKADEWAEHESSERPFRQIAADFSNRAVKCLDTDRGRLCMILPLTLFLGSTSRTYLKKWLQVVQPIRVINFGDLQQMLFEGGSHGCVVVLAKPRTAGADVPTDETFEYCVPKAEASLAIGRLSLNSGDRHVLQTRSIQEDHLQLVTLMWGNSFDVSLLARLGLRGTIGDFTKGRNRTWTACKGFHEIDRSRDPASDEQIEYLRSIPHIRVDQLRDESVVLRKDAPVPFDVVKGITPYSEELAELFGRPRVLFPDGFDARRELRAVFTDVLASFTVSVNAIAGPPNDPDVTKFLAVMLRSSLGSYFMVMHGFQLLVERNKISLTDVCRFPFFPPDRHADPQLARDLVNKVSALVSPLAMMSADAQVETYAALRPKLDDLVFRYYQLTSLECDLVKETVREIIPAIRPRGLKKVYEQAKRRARRSDVQRFAERLESQLIHWKEVFGGSASISIEGYTSSPSGCGPLGVVKISARRDRSAPAAIEANDRAVRATIEKLAALKVAPMEISDGFYYSPDQIYWVGPDVYLVRPLVPRLWLDRIAVRDAYRIVHEVQQSQLGSTTVPA